MKLYATVQSERASKGQGGNEYLNIEITDEKEGLVWNIGMTPKRIVLYDVLTGTQHKTELEQKGEKQKDETLEEFGISDNPQSYTNDDNNWK